MKDIFSESDGYKDKHNEKPNWIKNHPAFDQKKFLQSTVQTLPNSDISY